MYRGRSLAILDTDGLDAAVREMAPQVDSIVVSGLFSVHNPYHELEVAKMIKDRYGVPVVMGHQLTGELGIHERTVTAVLNARLIPVLSDFLGKVQVIMSERGSLALDGVQGRWHPDEHQDGDGTTGGHDPFRTGRQRHGRTGALRPR